MSEKIMEVFAREGWQLAIEGLSEGQNVRITYLQGKVTTYPGEGEPHEVGPEGYWDPVNNPNWPFWMQGARRAELCAWQTWLSSQSIGGGTSYSPDEAKTRIGSQFQNNTYVLSGKGRTQWPMPLRIVNPKLYFVVNDDSRGASDNLGSFLIKLEW